MNDADDDHVCAPPQTVQRLLDVLDGADDDVTVGRRLEHMMSLELRDDVTGLRDNVTGTYRRSHDDVIERYSAAENTLHRGLKVFRVAEPYSNHGAQ